MFVLVWVTVTMEGLYDDYLSSELASGLEALFAPLWYLMVSVNQLAMLISISLHFIPTIIEEAETVTRAQKSRRAPFNSANTWFASEKHSCTDTSHRWLTAKS